MRLPFTICLLVTFMPGVAASQQLAAAYSHVAHPTLAQAAPVENLNLNWSALQFTLTRGQLALAAPADGHTTAAVFSGTGVLVVAPTSPIERQQIAYFRGMNANGELHESFTDAVFHFADGAAFVKALGDQAHFAPLVGDSPLATLLADRAKLADAQGLAGSALLLQDLGTAVAQRLLRVDLKLTDGKWIQAAFDPLDADSVAVTARVQRASTGLNVFNDEWTHFVPPGEGPAPLPFRLDHYQIQIDIPDNLDMGVAATFDLTALVPLGNTVLLSLDSRLRLTAAALDVGKPVAFLQPNDPGRTPDPYFAGNWVLLQLPQPLAQGQTAHLKVSYHGKEIITKEGPGNFFCQSEAWYPGNRFGAPFQRADFNLHFKVNKDLTVVATGERVSTARDGNFQLSDWKSEIPLTVAGFALGDYKEYSAPAILADGQKVTVKVFANNRPDDLFSSIGNRPNLALGNLDAKILAPKALLQVTSALQFMSDYYGPYPYSTLSVTPIPADYGQGWPSLLYLSTLSFLDSTQLHELGMRPDTLRLLSDTFRAHETSHQWWGHRVSWATPHDQWISEGFADASSLIYEERTAGRAATVATLQEWRRDLTSKNQFGHVPIQDGALWLGDRLSSSVDPAGYQVNTYDRGAYTLYMLREMMLDAAKPAGAQDAAFIAMMRDFTTTFANQDASTADFKAIAEKHMTAGMDLDGNHKLDWFFNQYVFGTGMPHVEFHAKTVPGADGNTQLTMTVENPNHWRGLLPVYIYQDDQHFVRGQLQITRDHLEQTTPINFTPRKVVANQFLDMLVDVKQ